MIPIKSVGLIANDDGGLMVVIVLTASPIRFISKPLLKLILKPKIIENHTVIKV